jgi:hypothetical protein
LIRRKNKRKKGKYERKKKRKNQKKKMVHIKRPTWTLLVCRKKRERKKD